MIDFAKTVANTRKYDSFVVRNISSQVASYVVLGEIDNEFVCVRVNVHFFNYFYFLKYKNLKY